MGCLSRFFCRRGCKASDSGHRPSNKGQKIHADKEEYDSQESEPAQLKQKLLHETANAERAEAARAEAEARLAAATGQVSEAKAARQAAEIAQSKLAHKLQYWLDANTALIVSVDVIHQQYIAKQAELDHLRGQMNQLRTQVERLVAVGVRH